MKKNWSNLSQVTRVVIISAVVGAIITLISSFTIFLGYPGWTIGLAIGSIIGVAVTALQIIGGNATAQGKSAGLTFAFYFLRLILLASGLLVPALLSSKMGISWLKYATFGVGIGYIPSLFIIIIVLTHDQNNPSETIVQNPNEGGKEE